MTPLRIVLDSNVIISGILFGGHPGRILEYILDGSVQCFTSLPILDEIREVLQRPKFGFSPDQALTLIGELHELCHIVVPKVKITAIAADPDDNMILECASTAQADVIISGDTHLLGLTQWEGIQILPPADFVRHTEGQKGDAHD